jgi:hypothetical protein
MYEYFQKDIGRKILSVNSTEMCILEILLNTQPILGTTYVVKKVTIPMESWFMA